MSLGPKQAAEGSSILCCLQGTYFAATGIWPLLHLRSFEAITGPKTDDWLVQTVGALVLAISFPLLRAWRTRSVSSDVILIGAGSAAALGCIDAVFVIGGVIPPIYLADAAAEFVFLIAWCGVAARSRT